MPRFFLKNGPKFHLLLQMEQGYYSIRPPYKSIFRGVLPAHKNGVICRGGSWPPSFLQMVAFSGASDSMTRPYKWFHTQKIIISDEVKFYIKIVENDEI